MWFHLFIYCNGEGANSCAGWLSVCLGADYGLHNHTKCTRTSLNTRADAVQQRPTNTIALPCFGSALSCVPIQAFMKAHIPRYIHTYTCTTTDACICAVVAAIREGEIVFLQHRNLWCLYCGVFQKSELKLEAVAAEKANLPMCALPRAYDCRWAGGWVWECV